MVLGMESAFTDLFGVFKGVVFAGSFLLACLIQHLWPYKHSWSPVLRNWKHNLSLGLLNSVLFAFVCGNCIGAAAETASLERTGLLNLAGVSYHLRVLLSFIALDLVAYVFHRLYHRVGVMWRFHKVHHSDTVFETSTAVRFHPGEVLLSLGVRLVFVVTAGIPLGALLLFELVYILFNLLEHSDFNLPVALDRVVGTVFITPSVHRLHHSSKPEELNSNYGTILSLWDRMFGTFRTGLGKGGFDIGLGTPAPASFQELLLLPLSRK